MKTVTHRSLFLVDPTGELLEKNKQMAPRLSEIKGKRVGLLSSGSANGMSTEFVRRMEDLLRQDYGVADVLLAVKPNQTKTCPSETMNKLLPACDFLVVGVATGGSNALCLVIDAITAEVAGKPAVAVIGSGYERVSRTKARYMGMANLAIVVVPFPLGDKEQTCHKADAAVEDVVALATGKRTS